MKIFSIGLLILLVFILPSAAQDTSSPISIGRLLVNIEYADTISGPEFNTENLDRGLRNHLDFFLWKRGLEFEFLPENSTARIDSQPGSAKQHFLNIKVTASFKSEKTRLSSDEGNKKVTYGGILKLGLIVTLQNSPTDTTWLVNRNVICESRKEWVRDGSKFLSSKQTLFEPPDFVIMRALSQALDFLPSSEPAIRYSKYDIPVYMILDDEAAGGWDDKFNNNDRMALAYASRSLQRQFGFGLRPVGISLLENAPVPFKDLQRLFNQLLKTEIMRPDTFTVAIIDPARPEDYFKRSQPARIGLSDLGRHFSLLSRLKPPNEDVSEWMAFMNGQLLLHEVGHLLGAIHVSDLHSIMNPITAWVASEQFDILNRDIIEQKRPEIFSNRSISDYLHLVADALENTGYGLADYPTVYFSYININRFRLRRDTFGEDGVGRSIPFAVAGMQMFLINNLPMARDNFYKAWVSDTSQASIQYYLSKVTSGKLSELHLKRAAEMGYYQAIIDIGQSGPYNTLE